MQSIYRRIRPYKVTEEIVAQIKSLTKNGTLHPGEQLPSERILCGLLGVGR
jgi:DNA-binding FadR family transcriptional regulator